ncbi:MAG: peptide chain release factor N(5)-glutamine methyltransferase [Acidobacteria bacterium]|nr:peptide chain release factor N(5)-glutamine methyltransferase [Acidobacteriota bacterium]
MALLRDAHVASASLSAELLLMHVLGRDRAWLYAHPEEIVPANLAAQFSDLVAKRASGVPTQYLTAKQEFWGLEFEVTPDVLIPRPETEHLIEVALERLGPSQANPKHAAQMQPRALRIADIGTGSGCLAVALARELPNSTVVATDISAAALAVAQRNAQRHGVENRIQFVQCNLLDGTVGPFDLVVSNPPYVALADAASLPREVRDHEPHAALFGGPDGANYYSALVQQAGNHLVRGGILVVELGYNVFSEARRALDSDGRWVNCSATNDLAGIPRVLAAERNG